MLPTLPADLSCAWVLVSPLHNAYPLRPEEFLLCAALGCGLGTLCGLLAAAAGDWIRGGKGSGPAWGGGHGKVPRRSAERAALILAALLSLGALVCLLAPREASPSAAADVEGADERPYVVIMMPLRKDLHPEITSKAIACLRAMDEGNPELQIELFLFDKVVKRIPSDKRPLSKVARIRNMMIDMIQGDKKFDYVMWLDSDIIEYPPDLPTQLIRANPDGISAPLVLLEEPGPLGTDQFYDTTAFVQFNRSGVSDDPSPFVEGRNIGRLYPYVFSPQCEARNLYDWRCGMPKAQDLDSVGTIYMVSADIFTEGRAVFADHSFTEHYPLMEHATRMGRRIVVVTSVVARHANLPYYGEIFHENIFGTSDLSVPETIKQANVSDVIGWIGTITSAYCDVLGRYPDEGGFIAYLSLLQRVHALEGNTSTIGKETIISTLQESDEAAARLERIRKEQGAATVSLEWRGPPYLQYSVFSAGVLCLVSACGNASWSSVEACRRSPFSDECTASRRDEPDAGVMMASLSLYRPLPTTPQINITEEDSDGSWVEVHDGLTGWQHAVIVDRVANFSALSIRTPGVYRFRAKIWSRENSTKPVYAFTPTFLVKPHNDTDNLGASEDGDAEVTPLHVGKREGWFVVFAHGNGSKASELQLLDAVRQAYLVHKEWAVRVYVDASVSKGARKKMQKLGVDLVDADKLLPDMGAATWSFWPFPEDPSVSRFLVREAGFDIIAREGPAVSEWISSGRALHVARDSVLHFRPFSPRLWGCTHPCSAGIIESLGGMRKAVLRFLEAHGAAVRTDAWFGDTVVWPSLAGTNDALAHDSLFCLRWPHSVPFPTPRTGALAVGQLSKKWHGNVDSLTSSTVEEVIEDATQQAEWTCQHAPLACRRDPNWTRG